MCLLGTAQLLKLWNQIGLHHLYCLFAWIFVQYLHFYHSNCQEFRFAKIWDQRNVTWPNVETMKYLQLTWQMMGIACVLFFSFLFLIKDILLYPCKFTVAPWGASTCSLGISNLITGYSNFGHGPLVSALSRNLLPAFLPTQSPWIKRRFLISCLRYFCVHNSLKSVVIKPLFIPWLYPTIVRGPILLYIFKFLHCYLIFSVLPSQMDSLLDEGQRCHHLLWFCPVLCSIW